MKILLDECLNWRLKREFIGQIVFTVQDMGWSGMINGELMSRASENGFEVFVTIDKRLRYQQNVKKYNLAIIVFETQFNRLEYLKPLIPAVLKQLPMMVSGEVYEVR